MNKRISLFLIIFLVFPSIVFSIKTFVIQETEKISLQTSATDPDKDNITTKYSAPFNENGEWQTTYGDAGQYTITVTASDGELTTSKDVLVIVNKKEEAPEIESFIPKQDISSIKETESLDFRVLASDVNNDNLIYEWFLDGEKIKDGPEFTYETTYKDSGSHKVYVAVSDGTEETSKDWKVNVENVDINSLLDSIPDVSAIENEVVRLNIPDFEKYSLTYTISDPVGNKNEWITTYNDAGTYDIKIHAEGREFSGDKIVKVTVNDVDMPPIFEEIGNKVVNENEELKIILAASDPDGDEITYSAENLPEGAELEENIFIWKPSYDTIKKQGFVNWAMDKFRILSKSYYVRFVASSKDKKIVNNVVITVRSVNRAPVIEDMEPINISEGETIRIVPKAYDNDGDKIKLKYSGFIKTDTYKSEFGDAGTYDVKVTASDGSLETSKFVQINIRHVNREPVLKKIPDIKANENDNIAVLLNAHDPDGDEITYSIDNPPESSSLKENTFFWTPSYGLSTKESKKFDLVFVASDGEAQTRQIVKAEIMHKNKAPKIVNASASLLANVNEPVLMFVNAVDDDGDALTYTWDFGFFETYRATPLHQRIFTSLGTKTVKVVVSDGIDETEQAIIVNVI